ncbi:protein lava lamp isoform X1 [Papilio machaon]|uniref:protein lava lamp isoform X1 n=1 Tax=Papilio machaon TaxID=76193 RepID=UPI001E66498D|nr:protein lava lamp isoform X1 [Papilio machaon]
MSDNKNVDNRPEKDQVESFDTNLAVTSDVSNVVSSVRNVKHSTSSERQNKVERAQKCLENAALVSKRIKEQRKATAELLGRPFEDDVTDTASEMASTMSERTSYSVATDTSTTLSVQDALNIPGISESLANTLKQKELLMERIKQYKEISKRPMRKSISVKRESSDTTVVQEVKKSADNSDVAKLINTVKEKENALIVMQVKIKALETTILDLQEKINEKDQIIEAKNKATTLITDSLSKKEKDTLDLLEDTRQQMTKMQSNFIAMETEWKDEKQRLLDQIGEKDEKIKSLEEANTILENSRFEISIAHSKLAEELELKTEEILKLQEKIETMTQKSVDELSSGTLQSGDKEFTEEKGTLEISNMEELTKKLELLEQINCQMRQTNKDLENQLLSLNPDQKATSTSPAKRTPASPHPSRKGGRSAASKSKSPWRGLSTDRGQQETEKSKTKSDAVKQDMVVQSLNKDILDKEYLLTQKDDLISKLKLENSEKENIINNLQAVIETSKCETNKVDIAICTDPLESIVTSESHEIQQGEVIENIPEDVQTLKEKLESAQSQINQLNEEIDVANKNMIKVKSSYKIKLKQLQKTIDSFSKVSDANAEIVKLNEELHQLSQKVAELEEEKGNLQLHLVDYDSGRLTDSDIYKKLVEMETLADSRLKSITLLETQKFELVQELHVLQQKNDEMEDKLADMAQLQNDHVCSEIKSVQMEEQIDELVASKKELELVIDNLKLDKEQSTKTIKALEEEKDHLIQKLENYMQENMELTDKFEKLSAEKVSSAESIEMVESLTTQEKLELEEYNRTMAAKQDDNHSEFKMNEPGEGDENITELIKQSAELRDKVELFTQEKQEVLEKMNKVCAENEDLQERIKELKTHCDNLTKNIDVLSEEKNTLQLLNEELNNQIEVLKHERFEIMKESVEIAKPASMEESTEGISTETSHDDKLVGDKSNNRSKSVKQLTKDILKLKGTIKEREAEIADCQMKILSLEEQQEKQKELMQNITILDNKVKNLTEENSQLKREIETAQKDVESEQQYKQAHDVLQQEIQKIHQEYSMAINARDTRINELENLLVEYEKQMFNYGNSLQQKDKETAEYINQITKLNDVSQKLKSTIDLLEEEKAKDQNAELVKALNKDIMMYQKKLAECEEKLRGLEDEKVQLLSVKSSLEVKANDLELELKNLQEALTEKQAAIKDLQTQQQKHDGELSSVMLQAKERDEEIHEIKLQLRKESIENEKLRNEVSKKVNETEELKKQCNELKQKVNVVSHDKENYNERQTILETKNKELMDKLKKLAITLKRKTSSYNDLELDYNDKRKELEDKNLQVQDLLSKVEFIPQLEGKIKDMEKEYDNLQNEKLLLEQRCRNFDQLQVENETLHKNHVNAIEEISKLHTSLDTLNKELICARDDNDNLKNQISALNNKLVEYEIEQKNSSNLSTKITSLESDLSQKQALINELSVQLESQKEHLSQIQFGHDAKVQECNLYIESLQTEIDKYKNRICRLEESISTMENRRHSLERKADQLDNQLQEKQKAYTEYTHQEDELVNRLAVLIDHDRVVEKQLHVIEHENRELQHKVQHLNEEMLRLKNAYLDLQNNYTLMQTKAAKGEAAESELVICQSKVYELEASLKHITNEYQTILAQKKVDIEELESEFNTQIENAIKEKKILSENHERLSEHVTQLERKLQEYKDTNVNLNLNLQEISAVNQNLLEKSNERKSTAVDYTDQYVSEINKLNAVVNNKNQQIIDLENDIKSLQTNKVAKVSELEGRMAELSSNLARSEKEIELMSTELKFIKENNEELQMLLLQKDDQIKHLTDKSKVVFEMTIPKTEGMTISSTIEQVNDQSGVDLATLESQIVPESFVDEVKPPKKITESTLVQSSHSGGALSHEEVQEPVIVAKKSYDCYKKDSDMISEDPFCSQEGWGFEGEETEDASAGYTYLNEQIEKLRKENDRLKGELDNTNVKLSKVLKISKELKAKNELLSNELKISKQLSDKSILDTAIESELSSNIEVLEKQIQDLNTELEREKREKEALRKQNEIFKDANDRLTEIKEKLDTEIELWKFKCNQANDKISSLQWTTEPKESPAPEIPTSRKSKPISEEIVKLEQENEELQSVIDELNDVNKKLTDQRDEFSNEVQRLQEKIQENRICDNCESLQIQILSNEDCITSLRNDITNLNSKVKEFEECYKNVSIKYEELSKLNEENQNQYELKTQDFITKISTLDKELSAITTLKIEADETINSLKSELEGLKYELLLKKEETSNIKNASEAFAMSEKMSFMEVKCNEMSNNLEYAKEKITHLENENLELKKRIQDYEKQTEELSSKIKHLNTENDQLLSTVAELRSSVSSAVDQRGYEIAELWKQHLAQRENEFQRIEHELRTELTAAETKYEQLLDNVQSSTQDETNNLIVMEQLNSLQSKLQEKSEHLTSLQNKYADVIHQLDMLRSETEDEKLILENKMLVQQEEYEKTIKELTQVSDSKSLEFESIIKNLESEISAMKNINDNLNQQILELRSTFEVKIQELGKQLQIKETEIHQKSQDYTIALSQRNEEFENVRKHLIEYEKKIEDLTYEKEAELAVLRLKMHENKEQHENIQKQLEDEKNSLSEALNTKIIECTNLNKQVHDLNALLQEHATKSIEMQEALENQELEIVSLKDEISNMQELMRSSSSKIDKHVSFASDTKQIEDSDKIARPYNKDLLDAVPRAELDIALYMLHQRDVRCEELTMELTQLLEERDTLQLRLSDSLRALEDLKSKSKATEGVSMSSGQDSITELPSFTYEKEQRIVDTHRAHTSRSSSISDYDGEKPKLQAKLTELRSVKHSRDVTLRQDSEQRQLGMRLLRRDVANLPPEALEELTQAHHTLSRDSQSTSTVLLNWLRGKSTPKVVHM